MNCTICNKEIYDKFNNYYIVSYCDVCKLEQTTIQIFKNIIQSIIAETKYKYNIKLTMINYFLNNFYKQKFGIIVKSNICKHCTYCSGSINTKKCYIYQYNYNNFKFYYCYFHKLILYKKEDIDILINFLYKQAKKDTFKFKLKKTLNFIKELFIKVDNKQKE